MFLETYLDRYSQGSESILSSNYEGAIGILKDLYTQLLVAQDAYSAGRGPASMRPVYQERVQGLLARTQEAYNQIEQNLSIEYQTQIADAEQYISNRQYVLARKEYDKILQSAPYFDEVRELRKALYAKIIVVAKNLYRGALIYESIGNVGSARMSLKKAQELLNDVRDYEAIEYLDKAEKKLAQLQN